MLLRFIKNSIHLLLFIIGVPVIAQDGDTIYTPQHQEKVYLHFDQTAYFLEETMWFNAYVLDESNRPTDISRVLYVELVSPEGGVVNTFKGKIENGTCHGQFVLDSAYLSGFFEVRAYTRYMMNFGKDNYFSRVFPIYDKVINGDYHIHTMLRRTRPDLSNCHNPNLTLKEKRKKTKKIQNDSLPRPIQKALKFVIQHYNYFTPETICCTNLPQDLHTNEKVELTFRTIPNSTFSLSITSQVDRIPTNYIGDIYHSLFRDSSWVARSYYALRDFNPQKDIQYSPEKGITVDGDIFKEKRGQKKLLPQVAISLSTISGNLHFGGNMITNAKGQWSFTLDDFYGTIEAIINAVRPDFFWGESKIRMYKWFSPQPRLFSSNEYSDKTYLTVANTVEEDIKNLKEITVTAKNRKWKGTIRSLVRYSCLEECEFALDQTNDTPFNGTFSSWNLAANILSRYYYPERLTRILKTKDYPKNHAIPNGEIYDGPLKLTRDIKEIIVRTDRATCMRYDYSHVPFQRNIERDPSGTFTIVHKYKSLGIPIKEDSNTSNMKYLNYLVCLIPYSDEELKAKENLPHIKLSPTSRITVIHGFTRPKKFYIPNYKPSHENMKRNFRRTLYWNPNVKADAQGFARITFYNSNNCRSLHISAEGIGANGNPIIYYKEEQK